jgi:hypothetical protein
MLKILALAVLTVGAVLYWLYRACKCPRCGCSSQGLVNLEAACSKCGLPVSQFAELRRKKSWRKAFAKTSHGWLLGLLALWALLMMWREVPAPPCPRCQCSGRHIILGVAPRDGEPPAGHLACAGCNLPVARFKEVWGTLPAPPTPKVRDWGLPV